MDYSNFQQYPINILGIDETYNDELNAIEQAVIDELDYSGDADDIEEILPYFVFYFYCQDKVSMVSTKGEMYQTAEFSGMDVISQNRAWNIGAKKLLALCTENGKTANENYQSQRMLI